MKELITRIFKMTKIERLERLCVLGAKELITELDAFEQLEIMMIQSIRELTGELDEIRKEREINPL